MRKVGEMFLCYKTKKYNEHVMWWHTQMVSISFFNLPKLTSGCVYCLFTKCDGSKTYVNEWKGVALGPEPFGKVFLLATCHNPGLPTGLSSKTNKNKSQTVAKLWIIKIILMNQSLQTWEKVWMDNRKRAPLLGISCTEKIHVYFAIECLFMISHSNQ